MALFQTILHPTDFDSTSLEAFRVARTLARQLGARVVAFHIVPPPAIATEDGRVILDPKNPVPVDLWVDYRAAQIDTPEVTVHHTVVVGREADALRMLAGMISQDPGSTLIVMGTHGRTGLRRMIWGNRAEEVVRTVPCSVLVVKEQAAG